MGRPSVSLVVPLFNRPRTLAQILRALDRQTLPAGEFEAVFVDDSGPESYAVQRAVVEGAPPRCAWALLETGLPRGVNGVSVARNLGIARARGEVVVFMDDDCVPHRGLLEEHLRAHRGDPRLMCVGNRSEEREILEAAPPIAVSRGKCRREQEKSLAGTLGAGSFITANASARRADILEAGGFDEAFSQPGEYGYEDRDLGDRLLALGLAFRFLPDAVVWMAPKESDAWAGAREGAAEQAHRRYKRKTGGVIRRIVRAVVRGKKRGKS